MTTLGRGAVLLLLMAAVVAGQHDVDVTTTVPDLQDTQVEVAGPDMPEFETERFGFSLCLICNVYNIYYCCGNQLTQTFGTNCCSTQYPIQEIPQSSEAPSRDNDEESSDEDEKSSDEEESSDDDEESSDDDEESSDDDEESSDDDDDDTK